MPTLMDEPTDHFDTQMLQVEETNRKVRSNKEIRELQAQHSELELRSQGLTTRIERLDKQKDTALADAPFPLPGLAFSSTGVSPTTQFHSLNSPLLKSCASAQRSQWR
jgi:hypothetical protein